MEAGLGACDEGIAMRNRLLILVAVLALMGSACAGVVADGEIIEDETATTATTASDQAADLTPSETSTDSVGEGDSEDQSKVEEQAEPSESSTTTTRATKEPERVPGDTTPPVTGETPADLLAQIIADAAERAGVSDSDLTVIRDESVIWNDGSLGCPEPGVMYTQALVDGYWIVVAIGGIEYDYRVGAKGGFKLCSRPLPPSESSGSGG